LTVRLRHPKKIDAVVLPADMIDGWTDETAVYTIKGDILEDVTIPVLRKTDSRHSV